MKNLKYSRVFPAWLPAAAVALCVWLAPPVTASTEAHVLRSLQTARDRAGLAPLARRPDLDRVARERAAKLAAMPHRRRLSRKGETIGQELSRVGIVYRRVALHVDLNRGYDEPSSDFLTGWRGYEQSWELVLSPEFEAIGLAVVRAADKWVVLVAVLLGEPPPIVETDLFALETATVAAANRERVRRGLHELSVHPSLTELARDYSRDMARREYFDHRSPAGDNVQDRVRQRGLVYRRIGENLHKSFGVDDPVATAIESWLNSPEHRELLLSPLFLETGVGVAVDDEGAIYFTQLFLTRP